MQYTDGGSMQRVLSDNVAMMTISGLHSTNYSIQVAAINSAGTGVYSSPPINAFTDGKTKIVLELCVRWTFFTHSPQRG